MNVKTLLAAVDGGEQTNQVLDLARSFCRDGDVALHVLSVADSLFAAAGGMAEASDLSVATLDAQAHETVRMAVAYLAKQGIKAQDHVAFGNSAQMIVDLASRIDADLIVVGHRHMSFWRRLFDSSTCAGILEQAPCPVLVTTEKP